MSFSFENCLFVGNSEFLEEITSWHSDEIENFTSANRTEFFSDVECYFENEHEISDEKLKARKKWGVYCVIDTIVFKSRNIYFYCLCYFYLS